jgi:uroporphyrinogen-III synthase
VNDRRPLAGRRILVTRPRGRSRPLVARLRALGAEAVAVPTISIIGPRAGGPLDGALQRLAAGDYQWVIVTSANGVRACCARARALGIDLRQSRGGGGGRGAGPPPPRARRPAIGPATARALRAAGVVAAMMPSRFLTDAVAEEIPLADRDHVLLPRTDAAPPGLTQTLRRRGAVVDEVAAYRTVLAPPRSRARVLALVAGRRVDTVVVTSPSTVRGLVRLLGDRRDGLRRVQIACIGPVTAAAAVEEGLRPAVVAEEHTVDGLLAALVAHVAARPGGTGHARDRAAR